MEFENLDYAKLEELDYAELEELCKELGVFPMEEGDLLLPMEEGDLLLPMWLFTPSTSPPTSVDTLEPVVEEMEDDPSEDFFLYNLVTKKYELVENPDLRPWPEHLPAAAAPIASPMQVDISSSPEVIEVSSSPEPSPEIKVLCEIRKRPRDDDDDDDEDFFAPCHCFNCLPPRRKLF